MGSFLDANAQFTAISELQGQFAAHRRVPSGERNLDSLVMRPRKKEVDGHTVITWSVGHVIDHRLKANYDAVNDRIDFEYLSDAGVRFTDFVAVPDLSAFAVDDRASELHLGGKQATNRFRSIFRMLEGADAKVVFEATPEEVRKALREWSLTRFKFTIQPNNPRPVSRLAEALSEQFKLDGIGVLTGDARPVENGRMQMDENGFIATAADLVDAGYGQMSVSGFTEDGLEAEIKKPRFDPDVSRNEKIQTKPRELRVYIEDDDINEDEISTIAAKSLILFHEESDDGQQEA